MSGQAPKIILADQSAAMAKEISLVMLQTQHRFCLWHIYLNVFRQLSSAYTTHFKRRFKSVIYGPENAEDFF